MFVIISVTPTTGHIQSNDDDMSSLASSPTSSGPLSPKTPTGTMRSTSQVNYNVNELRGFDLEIMKLMCDF